MHKIGYATGLVWTPTGSSLVQIKATLRKGSGRLAIDGDIGLDFLLSLENAIELAANHTELNLAKINMTITVPGMIDGPSAGLPLFIAIYSAISKRPVVRNMGFIGELNSDGMVLAVGGILDKLAAATRAKLKSVVLPLENFKNLTEQSFPDIFLGGAVNMIDALIYAFE